MIETILLVWAISCLLFVLALSRFNSHGEVHVPAYEMNPSKAQVDGVIGVYEILGMYEGTIQ